MGTAEELAFLLQESGTALVDASDVLHVVDRSLTERNKFMPKGMTEADAWMARNGNPLASTESAFRVAGIAGSLDTMVIDADMKSKSTTVVLKYMGGLIGNAKADTMPIAICAAIMDALDRKGKANV